MHSWPGPGNSHSKQGYLECPPALTLTAPSPPHHHSDMISQSTIFPPSFPFNGAYPTTHNPLTHHHIQTTHPHTQQRSSTSPVRPTALCTTTSPPSQTLRPYPSLPSPSIPEKPTPARPFQHTTLAFHSVTSSPGMPSLLYLAARASCHG